MADVRSTLMGLFPQARITSGYRSPDSALGRANPRSYHNSGHAYDVAPIPGVSFDDYVGKLKGAGVNVVEALDEQTHPKPWTTGPNWHIAFGDSPVPQAKPRTLASLQQQPLPPQPGTTLADLQTAPLGVASQGPVMPQGPAPEMAQQNMPQLHKHASLGEIIAAGLNGYVAASGNPIGLENMRMMEQAKKDQQDNQLQREHWSAQLEAQKQERMAKLMEPPQWLQDAQTFNALPKPQQDMVRGYFDVSRPVTYSGPMGSGVIPRVAPTTQVIDGVTYYNVGGKWFDNPEGH